MGSASKLCLSCIIFAGASAAGCVPLKPPSEHPDSGVAFEVRLNGAHSPERPLIGLMVSVDAERGAGRQLAFEPQARTSTHYTDFHVRLDLPAGRYRLRRVSGVTRGGMVMPRFDTELAMAFEVRAGATHHLGRVEIGDGASGSQRE